VCVLNSIGLLVIGAPYAILLGVIGAILNLIPYIGGLIAMILTAIVTFKQHGRYLYYTRKPGRLPGSSVY
jgi:predicted PurR-regulated permease PerM